jgi:hypothetical protein
MEEEFQLTNMTTQLIKAGIDQINEKNIPLLEEN